MVKRILFLLLLLVSAAGLTYSQTLTKSQNELLSRNIFSVIFTGDAIGGEKIIDMKVDKSVMTNIPNLPSVKFSNGKLSREVIMQDLIWTITYQPTGGQTIYDLQSNGTPQQIWQDPIIQDFIHSVFMSAEYGDLSFTNRRSKYYFSHNKGTNWMFITEAGMVKTGFCVITGTSEGNALIGNHGANGGGNTRTQFYYDAAPGLGSFTLLNPPANNLNPCVWPRVVATNSILNTRKFVYLSAMNGIDSTFRGYSNSLSLNNFGPWQFFNSDQAETYAIARSTSGAKIGIVYKANEVLVPADYGDVYYVESIDDGLNWSVPLKIFKANFITDSLAALRGLSLVYQGEYPKAVFETIKQTTAGNYFPGAPAKIRFWSTTLPGSDPNRSIVLADTSDVGWHPNFGVNDVLGTLCRPAIGRSSDGIALFCVFMVPSDFAGGSADTTPYKDIWAKVSGDGGFIWSSAVKINFDSPRLDWAYPSVSQVNDRDSNFYYFNIVVQADTIPGSFINSPGNGQSLAQQYHIRVSIPKIATGFEKISNEITEIYSLSQNYPNPFNSTTNIKFRNSNPVKIKLKIFDVTGKEVTVLVNDNFQAGNHEVKFDAKNLPGGIYFYRMEAGKFTSTKKIIILK
ncbi:MAG: T9SS type A sorting domain-containing protein [Ignavibacteria bacterium]|nr:T9SS type A sorting domain-containing protein [Ignavibacteria bacterium]